mgnify:CR=1 FL=1
MRFMREVISEVMEHAKNDIAVVVKTNTQFRIESSVLFHLTPTREGVACSS